MYICKNRSISRRISTSYLSGVSKIYRIKLMALEWLHGFIKKDLPTKKLKIVFPVIPDLLVPILPALSTEPESIAEQYNEVPDNDQIKGS